MSQTPDPKPTCAAEPCGTCPYRLDAPRGVFALEEYKRLLVFDLPLMEQPLHIFKCHGSHFTGEDKVCRGWLDAHDELLGARVFLTNIASGTSSAPLFESAKALFEANLAVIEAPPIESRAVSAKLIQQLLASYLGPKT